MRLVLPPLYVILDATLLKHSPQNCAQELAAAGVRLLQYRDKSASAGELLETSRELVSSLESSHTALIVNDRPDVAALAGARGVQFAMNDKRDGSVTIHRVGDYKVEYRLSALEDIGGKTRVMPDEFIAASGSDVTEAFRAYLKPLLGTGMPQPHRLAGALVAKILGQG